jgi:predicted enzyme related to lactoylglutathione lyase
MTTPHLPGKFIWFEHTSPDIGRARAFYEPLLGWHVEAMPLGPQTYHMILNGDQGIGGLLAGDAGARAYWLSHVSVTDVDDRFRAALAAGAKAVMPPADFPPVGRGATILDPAGARLSLWKSANGDRPDPEQIPVGDWLWDELWSQDAPRSLAFYEQLLGFTHEVMSMGAQGTYLVIKSPDGRGRGGIWQAEDPNTPPQWLPYVHVADCDASAAKAQSLGATLCVPPTDIPTVGRFTVVFDPQGATLALMTPLPR